MNIFDYNRIMVIGNNGSGKSYLSKQLAAITGLPLVHLDAEYWLPNLTRPPDDWWRQKNIELISQEKWILDGNFPQGGQKGHRGRGGAMELRWAASDLVIFLDVNRFICLAGVIKRNNNGRPDGPPNFRETFDRRFLQMCKAIWDFSRKRKAGYLASRETNPDTPFFAIKGRREMHRLLREWKTQKETMEC